MEEVVSISPALDTGTSRGVRMMHRETISITARCQAGSDNTLQIARKHSAASQRGHVMLVLVRGSYETWKGGSIATNGSGQGGQDCGEHSELAASLRHDKARITPCSAAQARNSGRCMRCTRYRV